MEDIKNGMARLMMAAALLICLQACNEVHIEGDIESWKQEVIEAEADFARTVATEGMNKGFVAFAAEDAVLMRGNQLIEGKEAIRGFMANQNSKNLVWKPEYVDVAASGDLAYTYGYYAFSYPDSTGNSVESKGVFHSVWKRQADGSWKYVWD